MANFHFRMEPLLKLHRRGAMNAARRWPMPSASTKCCRSSWTFWGGKSTPCASSAGAIAPGSVNIERLVEARRYDLVTQAQQRNIEQQRQSVTAEIQRRRQALVEADREVRVLEKLRQRQAEQHRRDEELKEAKRLDEVATQQTFRKMLLAAQEAAP